MAMNSPSPRTVDKHKSFHLVETGARYNIEVSRRPDSKSGYKTHISDIFDYGRVGMWVNDAKKKFPPNKGWRHRVVKQTYNVITTTETVIVKSEVLK